MDVIVIFSKTFPLADSLRSENTSSLWGKNLVISPSKEEDNSTVFGAMNSDW